MAGDIGRGVYTFLQTKSGVTNLISTRMSPQRLPQNVTLPAATFRVVSGSGHKHFTGSTNTGTCRLQIVSYAATHIGAAALDEAIRVEMEHYTGAAGTETIDIVLDDGYRDLHAAPQDGSDTARYARSRDYLIIYTLPAVST